MPDITKPSVNPFREFNPFPWCCNNSYGIEEKIFSIKRNHGVKGSYKLHNPNDAINDKRDFFNKVLVEYSINDCSYDIFTVKDLLDSPYPFDHQADGNILGEIAERIARRVTKYFLKHLNKSGKTGGIFDKRFNPADREDFIVAHTEDYVLKIQQYPNLIILKRTGKGKYGYENIKELDGFFDYRYLGKRHILVLESKLEKINVDCDTLVNNLFTPLRTIFPEADFHYILFTDKNSIYVKSSIERRRQLKLFPVKIHERLCAESIGTIFFTFNESREDFEKIKEFLILQYRALKNLSVTVRGKTIISEKELTVFDGGETPHIKLVKDLQSGLWREIPLKHKS